jgi:hypothetical protein
MTKCCREYFGTVITTSVPQFSPEGGFDTDEETSEILHTLTPLFLILLPP